MKKIYRNNKGGYGNLKATATLGKKAIESAYTTSALSAMGLVILKGREYYSTGRGTSAANIRAIMGDSAYNYWTNTKGWLELNDGLYRATAGAINTLNARYSGTGPTFNTSREALQIVASCMRMGGDGGINYMASEYIIM